MYSLVHFSGYFLFLSEPEVMSSLTLAALRKRVQRAAALSNPVATNIELPSKTILSFGKCLEESSEALKYGYEKEYQLLTKVQIFHDGDTSCTENEATNVLLYDHEFLEMISPQVTSIFVDATFDSFPDLHVRNGQLLTIMVQFENINDCQKVFKNGKLFLIMS